MNTAIPLLTILNRGKQPTGKMLMFILEVCTGPVLSLGPDSRDNVRVRAGFGPGLDDINQTSYRTHWAFSGHFLARKILQFHPPYARGTIRLWIKIPPT